MRGNSHETRVAAFFLLYEVGFKTMGIEIIGVFIALSDFAFQLFNQQQQRAKSSRLDQRIDGVIKEQSDQRMILTDQGTILTELRVRTEMERPAKRAENRITLSKESTTPPACGPKAPRPDEVVPRPVVPLTKDLDWVGASLAATSSSMMKDLGASLAATSSLGLASMMKDLDLAGLSATSMPSLLKDLDLAGLDLAGLSATSMPSMMKDLDLAGLSATSMALLGGVSDDDD